MTHADFAPPETTRTDVTIGLTLEDQRTTDLRKVVYVDDRVVLLRDEDGHTTLSPRDSVEGQLGSRYRPRPDADPDVDGGQYDRLRRRLAEYREQEGRTARHKAEALAESIDLLAPPAAGDDAGDDEAGATDEDPEIEFEAVDGIGPETAAALRESGFVTRSDVRTAADDDLLAVSGVGPAGLAAIREHLS